MTKILVLYYSMYGHIEIMAKAIAEGARSANADVVIKRVPDTMSPEVAKKHGVSNMQIALAWILAQPGVTAPSGAAPMRTAPVTVR